MPYDLFALARQSLLAEGFTPLLSTAIGDQLAALTDPARGAMVTDLRHLPWSSIDNDSSRDLDQIEVADRLADGRIRLRIGIADVDAAVPQGSPIDEHASQETTTVYAGVTVFPMLPEQLSTGLTSLLEAQDRLVLVTELVVEPDGHVGSSTVYRALARNHFQLTYSAVGPWLEGGAAPAKIAASPELQAQLRLQDEAAAALRQARVTRGALQFERMETEAVIVNGQVTGLTAHRRNRASLLVEDFMLAANEAMARHLRDHQVASIRRVVRAPERWDRIVAIAAGLRSELPARPEPAALSRFLQEQRTKAPAHFHELSLSVMKLLGPGEYALELPGDTVPDHFSLAAQHYAHSTAPNRRFADVVTQRIAKAALAGSAPPYSVEELSVIASRCSQREDAARKVERLMEKRMAAVALAGRVGEVFPAVVTGVKTKGVFVRVCDPPLEGKLVEEGPVFDVGDHIDVRLRGVDVPQGHIDFVRALARQ
jgi:VacB/RNase II family 3'-5' exoribonuclease